MSVRMLLHYECPNVFIFSVLLIRRGRLVTRNAKFLRTHIPKVHYAECLTLCLKATVAHLPWIRPMLSFFIALYDAMCCFYNYSLIISNIISNGYTHNVPSPFVNRKLVQVRAGYFYQYECVIVLVYTKMCILKHIYTGKGVTCNIV